MTDWEWGTNSHSTYYLGRVHLVSPHTWGVGLCGLPVDHVWRERPAAEGRVLCPECCIAVIDAWYPDSSPMAVG